MLSDATVVNSDEISRITLCEEKVCGNNTHIAYVIVKTACETTLLNSSLPYTAYLRQWIGSALI